MNNIFEISMQIFLKYFSLCGGVSTMGAPFSNEHRYGCPSNGWGTKCPHGDLIKWKYFPRYWPFVWGIHRSPVNSPHKGQWRGALIFSLIYAWINGWVNNRQAGDLRRLCAHYDVIVMNLALTVGIHARVLTLFVLFCFLFVCFLLKMTVEYRIFTVHATIAVHVSLINQEDRSTL